jgi:hypothetical protein
MFWIREILKTRVFWWIAVVVFLVVAIPRFIK